MEREALEALFHCQSVGIALIDLDFRYVRVNDAIAAMHPAAPSRSTSGRRSARFCPMWPKPSFPS